MLSGMTSSHSSTICNECLSASVCHLPRLFFDLRHCDRISSFPSLCSISISLHSFPTPALKHTHPVIAHLPRRNIRLNLQVALTSLFHLRYHISSFLCLLNFYQILIDFRAGSTAIGFGGMGEKGSGKKPRHSELGRDHNHKDISEAKSHKIFHF